MKINFSKKIPNSTFYFLFSRSFVFILFSTFYFLFSVNSAKAAQFFIVPPELTVGQEAETILSINTEGDAVNAIELKLTFSSEDFIIKDINEGSSIISFWLENPFFSNEKGEIYLAGIIVGGYKGDDGRLLKINLIPRKIGENGFGLGQVKVLLNDGQGTEAGLNSSNLNFQIMESGMTAGISPAPAVKDTEPPEPFSLEIGQHPDIFNNQKFLVFATQDKNSGINYYQIREARQKFLLPFLKWETVQSPYLLKDQQLKSFVYVRAVDRAGNARLAILAPLQSLKWYENYLFWAIILLLIILAVIGVISKFLWKKYVRKH